MLYAVDNFDGRMGCFHSNQIRYSLRPRYVFGVDSVHSFQLFGSYSVFGPRSVFRPDTTVVYGRNTFRADSVHSFGFVGSYSVF